MLCLTLEVIDWNDKEHRRLCFGLSDRCKQMTNRIWQLWEQWHLEHGSPQKIRDYLAGLAEWKKTKQGEKPKLKCVAVDSELSNHIYHSTAADFPDLSSRTRGLLQNNLCGKIGKLKGAKGSLSGWMRILLCDDRRPGAIDPVPIPFDAANAKVLPPDDAGIVRVQVRLERHDVEGRKAGSSEVWQFVVKTNGKASRYAAPIFDVAEGRHKLKGSSLFYNASRRKWFMLVAYEPAKEAKPELDAEKVAILRPAIKRPFTMRVDGRTRWLGDEGRAIAHRRQQVTQGRWSRQENYRYAAQNRKGHGRGHALQSIEKLERSWKMFCKTYNETLATEAIARCITAGCGTLIFLRPKRPRFIECCGKSERRDASSWPWYGLEAFLRRKCARLGITLVEQRQQVKAEAVA